MDTVFQDIRKALDAVSCKRLLCKMEHIGGIRRTVLSWIKDREMRTVIISPNWSKVASDIPQACSRYKLYTRGFEELHKFVCR